MTPKEKKTRKIIIASNIIIETLKTSNSANSVTPIQAEKIKILVENSIKNKNFDKLTMNEKAKKTNCEHFYLKHLKEIIEKKIIQRKNQNIYHQNSSRNNFKMNNDNLSLNWQNPSENELKAIKYIQRFLKYCFLLISFS